jgi:hypothetical protein
MTSGKEMRFFPALLLSRLPPPILLNITMVSLRSALKATNCAVESITPEDDDPTICPACHKRMKTARGVQSHLGSARSCSWYKKGKLKELSMPGQFEEVVLSQDVPLLEDDFLHATDSDEAADDNIEPHEVMDDFHEQIFELIPAEGFDLDAPSPSLPRPRRTSNSLAPEDEDDDRLVVEHPTAGRHIRIVPTLHERWKKLFGGSMESEEDERVDSDVDMDDEQEDKFSPFASELDWRIAKWAVQEGIGHKSFDRLMSIPGVCIDTISHD